VIVVVLVLKLLLLPDTSLLMLDSNIAAVAVLLKDSMKTFTEIAEDAYQLRR
jgi:hypothetical protein